MKHPLQTGQCQGVTLTEVLVVVVIVSLLATIAVPVYVNKAEQAKIAIAKQEVREFARAEEACALAHQFYVPLQMLDDNVDVRTSGAPSDDLGSEDQNLYLIYATRDVEIQILRGQAQLINRSATSSPNYVAVNNLFQAWQGPFMNFNRAAFMEQIQRGEKPNDFMKYDFPLDPWGNPYRFYSSLGIIGTNALAEEFELNRISFSDGRLTRNDPRRFDRFAIVSFGPNGLTEFSNTSAAQPDDDDDDVVHLFGGVYTESSFRTPF